MKNIYVIEATHDQVHAKNGIHAKASYASKLHKYTLRV